MAAGHPGIRNHEGFRAPSEAAGYQRDDDERPPRSAEPCRSVLMSIVSGSEPGQASAAQTASAPAPTTASPGRARPARLDVPGSLLARRAHQVPRPPDDGACASLLEAEAPAGQHGPCRARDSSEYAG